MVRKLDPDAPRLDDFLLASGRVAGMRGDSAAASTDLKEAVARFRLHDGAAHPRTLAAERELARLAGARWRSPRVGPRLD
jgi:hypothetical protein